MPRTLAGESERFAARRQDGDVRTRRPNPVDERCERLDQVLAVVEHDQHLAVTKELDERGIEREVLALLDVERRGHGLDRGPLVVGRGQLDDAGFLPDGHRHPRQTQRQAGLSHAARPDERDEAISLEQLLDGFEIVVTTHETGRVAAETDARRAPASAGRGSSIDSVGSSARIRRSSSRAAGERSSPSSSPR